MKPYFCPIICSASQTSFFSRMTTSLVIVFLLSMPITGFGDEVVYRINPDSPPKMSVQEARDAIVLALSRRIGWPEIERVYLDGDDLVAVISTRNMSGKVTAGYNLIGQEIIKEGDFYKIPVKRGATVFGLTPLRGERLMIYHVYLWKSEEDARLFLDAVNVLRQKKYGGEEEKQQ